MLALRRPLLARRPHRAPADAHLHALLELCTIRGGRVLHVGGDGRRAAFGPGFSHHAIDETDLATLRARTFDVVVAHLTDDRRPRPGDPRTDFARLLVPGGLAYTTGARSDDASTTLRRVDAGLEPSTGEVFVAAVKPGRPPAVHPGVTSV